MQPHQNNARTDACSDLDTFVDSLLSPAYAEELRGLDPLDEPFPIHSANEDATTSIDVRPNADAACSSRDDVENSIKRQNPGPVQRTITNSTYLRRLYLSPKQALDLFPGIARDFVPLKMTRRQRALLSPHKSKHDIVLVNADGQRWPSALECAVVTNGQLHCCLVDGWRRFCKDNAAAVHDVAVLKPCDGDVNEIMVLFERGAA
jgi:B3 DNA binding domain